MELFLKTRKRFELREATTKDLDSLTTIQMAAFPDDPQWDYRFPHRAQYADDTKICTRRRFELFLEDDRYTVVLAEICEKDGKTMWPAAFAVWEDRQREPVAPSTVGDQTRRDADQLHMKIFRETLTNARKRLFDDDHKSRYIQLLILGTHPCYRRQGLGSSLCKKVMRIAKDKKACVSVFGSPMGKDLYAFLGFRELDIMKVQAVDEEQTLYISAMIYEAYGEKDIIEG